MFGFCQALTYNDKICSDWPTGLKKKPKLVGLANQASKTTHFVRISFKIADLMMLKCKYITANLILCIHPISSMCWTMGFLASHYNSFYYPQNILKFALQLESVIEGECSSIWTDCVSRSGCEGIDWMEAGHRKKSFF